MALLVKCDFCGANYIFPYVCKDCGKIFCDEHRLPESHKCGKQPPLSWETFSSPKLASENPQKVQVDKETRERLLQYGFGRGESEGKQPKQTRRRLFAYLIIGLIICASFGYSTGNSTGYSSGYIQGLKDGAGTGYNIRDPSYQEMLSFIAIDTVHNHPYVSGNYTCFNFANDFANEAFNRGFRCGVVYLVLDTGEHSLNCFKTTNSGLFFIEPQVAQVVSLVAGQTYQFEGYQPMGTVDYYAIVW